MKGTFCTPILYVFLGYDGYASRAKVRIPPGVIKVPMSIDQPCDRLPRRFEGRIG